MQVNHGSLTLVQTGPRAAIAPGAAKANPTSPDYNAFVKLLIAQMKHQDPTNPSDPTQFVAQLASFSSVEQAMQTNAKLDSLLSAAHFGDVTSAIGRTITSADGAISGKIVAVRIDAAGPVAILESGKSVPFVPGVILR